MLESNRCYEKREGCAGRGAGIGAIRQDSSRAAITLRRSNSTFTGTGTALAERCGLDEANGVFMRESFDDVFGCTSAGGADRFLGTVAQALAFRRQSPLDQRK